MRKKLFISCLLVFTTAISYTQITWPAITPVTKPWTRWWWMGSAVNTKDITGNMEQYQAAGLGGLEITPIYGVKGFENQFIDYLSPGWMKLFAHTLTEAKRLNMQIDMATGTGWPFGGGPLIGEKEACKNFVFKTYNVKAGESVNEPILFMQEPFVRAVGNQPDISTLKSPVYTNNNLQALALDQVKFRKRLPLQALMAYTGDTTVIDLTGKVDASGKLNWKADGRNWQLYAVFMGWHGKMVERAAPGGEGDVIDHFSIGPLKKYLSRFDKAFAGYDYSYLRGFFNDSYEVDDARGQSNWTPDFFNAFKRLRKYDLKRELPGLLQESSPYHADVLHDFRETIGDLLLENFTKPWQQWAKAKGKIVRNQSHGSPANILDLYAAVDIPETEGKEILRYKFAASAAHVTGKRLVSAEASTWLNDHFLSSLSDVKVNVDNYFVGGVNHIVYHGTNYSPQSEPWPGWLFYAAVHFQPTNPFWKDFGALNNYVTRCQSFLQTGKPDNDVLVYFPYHDRLSEKAPRDLLQHFDGMNGFDSSAFKSTAQYMQDFGIGYDFISDMQLLQVKNVRDKLQTGGADYQTILLPDITRMPLATVKKIFQLVSAGVNVLVYKKMPKSLPGIRILRDDMQFSNLLKELDFLTLPDNTRRARYGNGTFIVSDDLASLFKAARVKQEKIVQQGLSFIRRKNAQGTYYFMVNKSQSKIDGNVILNTEAEGVAVFNPMTGQAGVARFNGFEYGNTQVHIQLLPGESCILQLADKPIAGNPYPYYGLLLRGPFIENWNIRFLSGGPALPATVQHKELASWTSFLDSAAKKFSGTAKYTAHFPKPEGNAEAWLLDLGRVQKSAEVWLNGKKITTLIGPVYEVVIPAAALTADNLLEVYVSNSMVNRIIDLEKQGGYYKKFYNVNFPAFLAANRDSKGLFNAVNWQPEESGLLGPVQISPLSLYKN